ncbi:MAG: hypothetical protein FD123_3961 [Bacteroidetes bacterium]|nr:MAG: hypothetical protein FD123_3961 [Bacteroidota bacterium]
MLNIQKVVVLLDDYHLQEFRKYLEQHRAELPLKLVEAARRIGWEEKDSDALCKAIYGKAGSAEKKKFFQLAHHTFKLTSHLSRNYPSYLVHNISRIEILVNQGNLPEANRLADTLLDTAEKIEDFNTARAMLQYFGQQAFILEKRSDSVRYLERNAAVIDAEHVLNDIYLYLRRNLHFKDKASLNRDDIEKHLSFFTLYRDHPAFTVRLLARYACLYTLSYLNDDRFYSKETIDELNALSDELEKNPYVVFTFSDDFELNIDYIKLKYLLSVLNEEDLHRESEVLLKKREVPRFWRNYLNTAQVAFLSIQASFYISHYGFGYRKNYNEHLSPEIREQLSFYKKTCEEILQNTVWEEGLHVRYINMLNIYTCFQLLGSRDEIRKAADTLENALFNYQQVAFQRLYDAIFGTLIMAYFILEEYVKVQECYKRYEKLTAPSVKLPENDITIKAFYYTSQWLLTARKQYREKLHGLIEKTEGVKNLDNTRRLLIDLRSYFKI